MREAIFTQGQGTPSHSQWRRRWERQASTGNSYKQSQDKKGRRDFLQDLCPIGGMKGFKSSIKSVQLLIKHKHAEDQIRSRSNQLKGTTYNNNNNNNNNNFIHVSIIKIAVTKPLSKDTT